MSTSELCESDVQLPILIGSGVNQGNLRSYLDAHGWIIGSAFKKGGKWNEDIDEQRVADIMYEMKSL